MIPDHTEALERLYRERLEDRPSPAPEERSDASFWDATKGSRPSDAEVLEKLFAERTNKGRRLIEGDTSGYPSDSEADLALLEKLAFYTQDAEQLERIWSGSGLYRKKLDRTDYRRRTIAKALDRLSETYEWNSRTALGDLSGASAFGRGRTADSSDGFDSFSKGSPIQHVPQFPIDSLPSKVARYVQEAAASLSCPPEMVAIPAIAALSGIIGPRLEENPRGFLSVQDELTGFLRGLDQYKSGGKGNARQSYLKIWSNGAIHVDRKGSEEPVVVPKPYVTLQGGIQPAVLGEIADGRDDGFLDRFLFAYPEPGRGGWSYEEVSATTEFAYEELVGRLWDRGAETQGPDGEIEPRVLSMDEEAKRLFIAEVDNLAAERWSPGFPAVLSGPWSKMDTQLAKLALILAVTRSVDENSAMEYVSGEDMCLAPRLLEYFKATTRRVYGQLFEADPDDVLAHDLVTLLADTGYVYQGTISNLMKLCVSGAMPETPEALGKAIRRIARKTTLLAVESVSIGKERGIRLTLEKPVGTVELSEVHEREE